MRAQDGFIREAETAVVRRAVPADAAAIHQIALGVSRSELERAGAGAPELSRVGFLLYPLASDSTDTPNYDERIGGSAHFWVALVSEEIVGFLMAYTFAEFANFKNKTQNDAATIEFFTHTMGVRASTIYLAQIGVPMDRRLQGVAASLLRAAFDGVDGSRHPAAFAEIAQHPLWNAASSRAAIRSGFVPLFLRQKDVHRPENERRLSATFVRTFPWGGPMEQPSLS